MRGGTNAWRIAAAVAGLFLLGATAMYFANPFHTPLEWPPARIFGYATYRMPSVSMEPTIKKGAIFIVNVATLRDRDPVPGEIVVFMYPPNPRITYIKRVVAMGGSTVEIRAGIVYVDGNPLSEPYLAPQSDSRGDIPPRDVSANTFFVLGDNRGNSEDSRIWGPVPRENVIGVYNGLAVNN